jgi:hypothetical protein
MTPLDVICMHVNSNITLCGASVGEECQWEISQVDHPRFHAERIMAANEMTGGDPVTEEQINESGIV